VKLEGALDQMDREEAKEAEAAAKLAKKSLMADMDGLVNKQCVIVLTQDFKAKRIKTSEWKAQTAKKGLKKGITDTKTAKKMAAADVDDDEDDACEAEALRSVNCCHDFDALLVFTEEGNVFSLQALDVPGAKTAKSKATPIKEFMPDIGNEHVTAMVTIPQKALKEQADEFVVMVSRDGLAKKVSVDKFRSLQAGNRGKGIPCFKLTDGDKLKWALRGSENSALVMVTEKGFVLRTSLGPDWANGSARASGRKAIRLKQAAGALASACISDMTKEELLVAEKAKEIRAEKAAIAGQIRKEKEEREKNGEVPDASQSQEGGKTSHLFKAKSKTNEADDDDSDNEADAKVEEPDQDDAEDDGDDDDVKMEDAEVDAETQATPAEAAAGGPASQAAGEVLPTVIKSDWGTCLLMVTEDGWGMRVPFTHKRLQMCKKGRCGLRVMRVGDSDDMIGACIVGGTTEVKKPAEARKPFNIWYSVNKYPIEQEYMNYTDEKRAQLSEDYKSAAKEDGEAEKEEKPETEAKPEPEAAAQQESQEGATQEKQSLPAGWAFICVHIGRMRFRELPESERETYEKKAEQEKENYERQMEEYNKDHPPSEQVLVASKNGFISRIMVDTVPVIDKRTVAKGIRVVKIKGRDSLSSISLLSAADDTPDEPDGEDLPAVKEEAPIEEDTAEPMEEEPSAPVVTKKEATPKKMRSSSLRALPDTPPTNRQAKNSEGQAAAALLGGAPFESPGRRIRGKRSITEIASPSVDDRSVARPSLARSSSPKGSAAPGRGAAAGRGASTGRGRGRPAKKTEQPVAQATTPMRKALGKRSLSSLNMTEPTFG
jgi:DNA gyrase/topoisomerase IV subunit A